MTDCADPLRFSWDSFIAPTSLVSLCGPIPPSSSFSKTPMKILSSRRAATLFHRLLDPKKVIEEYTPSFGDEFKRSDIIAGVYEGGFKLWECSVDLAKFAYEAIHPHEWGGKRVLEAGCGHGLPGIIPLVVCSLELVPFPQCIVFQDYNMEVIQELTIPNAMKSVEENAAADVRSPMDAMDCTMFVSGDWENFTHHIDIFPMCHSSGGVSDEKENRFDIILTADTLYNENAVKKMVDMIIAILAPGGVCLLASKRFYFGCGGGVMPFRMELQKSLDARGIPKDEFSIQVVRTFTDGMSNVRDIIQVDRRKKTLQTKMP